MLLGTIEEAAVVAGALVLEGEPGIGKTALWRLAVDHARERGWRVLETAPTSSEARLAFAALGDLLDPEADGILAKLPEPQRVALEVALLRRRDATSGIGVDERMIGVATLSALRAIAAGARVLVAIDDLQWVDASSAAALLFALRRVRNESLLVLATRRSTRAGGGQPELERLLSDDRVRRIRVQPLSLGGIHEVLLSRLGIDASRPTLVRLHELTSGNPFFALEIGRELAAQDRQPAADEPLPFPGSLRDLVHARFERLSADARLVLLAAAALARPTRSLLARFHAQAEAALEEARRAGVIDLSSAERVRFVHPLFASIHYEQSSLAERRRVHLRLSGLVEDPEQRARHLALAAVGPDEQVAIVLDAAARTAGVRGSPQAAAELLDLAARLTPVPGDRAARLLASAERHRQAGHLELATERAREALRSGVDSEARARAFSVLGTVTSDRDGIKAGLELYVQARRVPGASRTLRADIHHKLAWFCLVGADARTAQRHAHAMMRLADGAGPAAEAAAVTTFSHVSVVRGEPAPRDLLERAKALTELIPGEEPWTWSETSPAALEGVVLLWGGELEAARAPLERALRVAIDRGDPCLEMHALAYLSSIEIALGSPRRGWDFAQRYLRLAEMSGQDAHRSGALWPVAVAGGWLGRSDEARHAAGEGLTLAERMGHGLYVIGNLTALGGVELSLGNATAAADFLMRAWQLVDRGGIAAPARFPVLSDAVEALVMTGEQAEADRLADRHDEIARRLNRPWALALAARCRALVAEARGEDERAVEAFERALRDHARQCRPLDHARTLLAYGRHQRRGQHKRSARELLEQSVAMFEAADAASWAERAREELDRIGGRRAAAGGELSASESAIAKLVAAGQTNNEVAAALHLSARTVEWNLSRLYRKLGVRSRTELAMALLAGEPVPATPGARDRVPDPGANPGISPVDRAWRRP